MLILTRKLGESINIGEDIRILVVNIKRGKVRIGIEAPDNMTVHRSEVYDRVKMQNQKAADLINETNIEPLSKILLFDDVKLKTNHKALVLKTFKKED